jgi:hypothetical protein
MSPSPADHFDATLPGASQIVHIASLHDAKVFVCRWAIRDKDPALKVLLRQMEKAGDAATADGAIRNLKQTLASRGMLVTAPLPNSL